MTREGLTTGSISEISRSIAEGRISPMEVVAAALDRCEALEPHLNAFITIDRAGATAAAAHLTEELQAGTNRGPLHGMPMAVKDLIGTRGLRTTAGSRSTPQLVPDEDAASVDRLRHRGAVIIGKTNLPEFAYTPCDQYHPEFGPTHNPWDLGRFPGGSSSGSAAAVAAGIVPAALGSDTGGSIRTPASFCGVSGFKPTYGFISLRGIVPLAPSMDHVGLLARTAEDCATLLAAVAGHDPRDPLSAAEADSHAARLGVGAKFGGVRVGVLDGFFSDDVEPSVAAAVADAIRVMVDHGAEAESANLATIEADVSSASAVLMVEASRVHERDLVEHGDDLVPDVRNKLIEGSRIPRVDYLRALESRGRVREALEKALAGVDVLVSPTCDTTAPPMSPAGRVLEPARYVVSGRPSARIPFNLAGLPAISIPCGVDPQGLPIGLQIAGRRWADWEVLAIAQAFQAVTDWHLRTPSIGRRRGTSDRPGFSGAAKPSG